MRVRPRLHPFGGLLPMLLLPSLGFGGCTPTASEGTSATFEQKSLDAGPDGAAEGRPGGDNLPGDDASEPNYRFEWLERDSDNNGKSDFDDGYNPSNPAASKDSDKDGTPDYMDTDDDGDGISDNDERIGPDDYDKDGLPNSLDDDSDGDGLSDKLEGNTDTDGDRWPNFLDMDSDQDGIADAVEGDRDTDGNGIRDALEKDADNDGIPDLQEGTADRDGDGIPNYRDTTNDGAPPALLFKSIAAGSGANFRTPIGIDYHQPTNSLVMSVNYSGGYPNNFERINFDGTYTQFSTISGLTDEVKIATARADTTQFRPGDLFVGNGKGGEIVRITNTAPGETLTFENPWVKLPGESGLMRGSLVVDRTGVYNGDLIVVTTTGGVWRIDGQKKATRIAQTSPVVHLEGVAIVPNFPARFGKLAGRILAGAEEQYNLHTFDASGERETFSLKAANALSIKIEDIDIVNPNENFFGVNYGTNALLGVSSDQLAPLVGDIILTQEVPPSTQSGMWTLRWNFSTNTVQTQAIPIKAGSATVGQWEHVTFAGAGFPEVPIPPPPTVDPPAPPPPPAR